MDLNRRAWLKGLAAIATVGVVKVSAAPQRDLYWSGWKEVPNQMVTFGYWLARLPDDGDYRRCIVSTTTGHVGRYTECSAFALVYERGWSPIMPWTPDAERDTIKQRAYNALRTALS